jgi:hypothetical protein
MLSFEGVFTVAIMTNMWIGAYEYGIFFQNGTCVVYDIYEYENFEDTAPLFTGTYEACSDYLKQSETAYLESLF